MTDKEKAAAKEKTAKAKAAEDAALTEAQTLVNSAEINIEISEEARTLGVKSSRIKMSGFRDKDPAKMEKEEAKHQKLVQKRVKARIAKAKAKAEMRPIDKRKALLRGRFKAIRARNRSYTYSEKNVEAWTEEFNMIKNSPKMWNQITSFGTKPYVPGNRKKKTPKEMLDGMDLD